MKIGPKIMFLKHEALQKKALFSKTEKYYCLSMFINHLPQFNVFNFVFKSSLSTISIKRVNAVPLWDFCASDFEVTLKIVTNSRIIYRNDNIARLVKVN